MLYMVTARLFRRLCQSVQGRDCHAGTCGRDDGRFLRGVIEMMHASAVDSLRRRVHRTARYLNSDHSTL